jgi:hypothetical protein
MTIRTTVRLPEDLMRRAKRKAAEEGRSFTALLEAGLRQVLYERPPQRPRRTRPPVSSAKGGLMPGIDLDDSARLQEADDIGLARRLK